jgi:histone deacetylase complex regulatory component SIN3
VYTLDKLLQHLITALQKMANDDSVSKLIGIFVYHRSRAGCEQGIDVSLYRAHCAALLGGGEEMFRMQLLTPVCGLPRQGDALLAMQTVG